MQRILLLFLYIMKSLSNIFEKFFDNVGAVNHVIKLERLGIMKFGEYKGKDCYHKRVKGGKIQGTNFDADCDLDMDVPYLDIYIMPVGKKYEDYKLIIAYAGPDNTGKFWSIYIDRSITYKPKYISYAEGRRAIYKLINKDTILDEWGYLDFSLTFHAVTVPEFNRISFPPHIETLIREVLKIDMND